MSTLPSIAPSAAAGNTNLAQKPPKSLLERIEALKKGVDAYRERADQYCQGVDQVGREVKECAKESKKLKLDVQKFEAAVEAESVAWDRTEQVVGTALVTMTAAAIALQTASDPDVAAPSDRGSGSWPSVMTLVLQVIDDQCCAFFFQKR